MLLVPYLELVSGLLEEQTSPRQRRFVVAGLLTIGALMVAENLLRINEFFFFWVPWALGAVYAYARLIRRTVSANSLALPGHSRCET